MFLAYSHLEIEILNDIGVNEQVFMGFSLQFIVLQALW